MTPEEMIHANGAALAGAINAGDAAKAASLYTEDAALMPPGAPAQNGLESIEAFWTGAIEAGLTDLALETVEITHIDDDIVETGRLTARMGEAALAGKYIVHWKRTALGWQLHRDIWNTDA